MSNRLPGRTVLTCSLGRLTLQSDWVWSRHCLRFECWCPELSSKGSRSSELSDRSPQREVSTVSASRVLSNNRQPPRQSWGAGPSRSSCAGPGPLQVFSSDGRLRRANLRGRPHCPHLAWMLEVREVRLLLSLAGLEWSWCSNPVLFQVGALFLMEGLRVTDLFYSPLFPPSRAFCWLKSISNLCFILKKS